MVSAHAEGYVLWSIIQESLRQSRPRAAPVNKVVTDEHSVCFRVSRDIGRVWATVGQAMMGICLAPFLRMRALGVNVVTKGLLFAPPQIGSLSLKSRVSPILVEHHCARHAHGVYDMFFTFTRLRSRPHNPVANLRDASDSGLAGR